jgi:NAD/NADP transhydrogenase beta subunit
MANTTVLIGVLLIALGLTGFIGTGMEHKTALIPAAFGLAILVFGMIARNPARRALAMHIAVTVGLLGFIGSGVSFLKGVNGPAMETRPVAVYAQGVMALITLIFVILCVRSFIQARRARAN